MGLRINELAAAKPRKGQDLGSSAWSPKWAGKDAIIVDREADVESAATGVVQSAYGYQGQKCSACSRAIVDEAIYDEFLDKVKCQGRRADCRPVARPSTTCCGPVISASAKKSILDWHRSRQDRRPPDRFYGDVAEGPGFFIQPTVVASTSIPKLASLQEEVFGPVLAVTKARDFDHALQLAK